MQHFKNGFYSLADFESILGELRTLQQNYNQNKHELNVLQVIEAREDLAIRNSELADIGADLYMEKQAAELFYRNTLLKRTEEIERELYKQVNDPETGRKWTDLPNRARYRAELECAKYKTEAEEAKAIHLRAYLLYSSSIPNVLNAMSSRISFLMKMIPQATTQSGLGAELQESDKPRLPSARNWKQEDDGFDLWDTQRIAGGLMNELGEEII